MSDNNFSLSRILVNEETQTSVSLYTDPQVFNINSDKIKLDVENSLYKFKYEIEEVERLVSAVNGNDISIRNKGRVISPHSKRFKQLLDSLIKQIQSNSRYLHTNKEQKILIERLIRSLAYAIDPASRYGKNKPNNHRLSLFSHQKYEHTMKLGCASIFFDDSQSFGNENKDYELVFSYQNSLCLMNGSYIFIFDRVSPDSLIAGKEFPITYRKRSFGSIILYDYPENEENENEKDKDKENPKNEEDEDPFDHHRVIMPIIDDDRTLYLVHGLGGLNSSSGQEINLKMLVNPYDFSFIDIILSIPRLTSLEATNFLIYLYKENYLSAYVRSKLCQFLYENRVPNKDFESEALSVKRSSKSTRVKVSLKTDLITNSLKSREWPELLGRFVTLLDHRWFIEAAHRMELLELPQVVKSIAKSSDSRNSKNVYSRSSASTSNPVSPINSTAQYLIGIILWEYELLERGDTSEFVWEFLCKSVFTNLYLNKNDERSMQKRQKLEALFLGTKEKPPTSKTRIVTEKSVERINKIVRNTQLDDIIPLRSASTSPKSKSKSNSPKSPIDSFNSPKFLLSLIKNHRDEIITVLKNIPRTTEEASPLFYPIALEVRDALYSNYNEMPRSTRSTKSKIKEEASYDGDEVENEYNNSNYELGSSKNKARASSLQRTSKSTKKQSRRANKKDDNQFSDDNDNRRKKNKNSQRAASVSNNSQSSSNSKQLNVRRPAPLKLRKQGVPINSKKSNRTPQKPIPKPSSSKKNQRQQKQLSEEYDEDEYVVYDEDFEDDEYEYEYDNQNDEY